jgi:hypothetical protein
MIVNARMTENEAIMQSRKEKKTSSKSKGSVKPKHVE